MKTQFSSLQIPTTDIFQPMTTLHTPSAYGHFPYLMGRLANAIQPNDINNKLKTEDRRHLTKQIKQAYLILFRFALSFQKIAGASDEKIEQALFSSLGLHYLYRRQAAPRKNLSKQNLNYIHFVSFCFSLGLHYLCIQNINKEKC